MAELKWINGNSVQEVPKGQVRAARITDAPEIAALSEQLGDPASLATVRSRLCRLLADRDDAIWVAENEGGTVAGWIHVYVKQVLESDREEEIGRLVIHQALRGQGARKALVERAERWARRKGLQSVYLRSNIVRKEAHVFYEKLGYKIIKIQSAFRKPKSDYRISIQSP